MPSRMISNRKSPETALDDRRDRLKDKIVVKWDAEGVDRSIKDYQKVTNNRLGVRQGWQRKNSLWILGYCYEVSQNGLMIAMPTNYR